MILSKLFGLPGNLCLAQFNAIAKLRGYLQLSTILQEMEGGFAEHFTSEVISMANGPSYARWSLEPYNIGMKLRTLRTQKHLTLSRLAAETGLSTALLSKLETDRMIPTLPTLANICRVYGVGLSYFFTEATRHALAITRKSHLGASSRGTETVRQIPLHAATANSKIVGRVIDYPPGAAGVVADIGQPVCSVVCVLEGSLHLDSGGMHEVLEQGDCVYVDSDMAIAWSAGSNAHCRALVVTPGISREG
jgi:transcriptional regulator with XRE-family HTH domain